MLVTTDTLPLVREDSWLAPYGPALAARMARYQGLRALLNEASDGGLLGSLSSAHHYLGINRDAKAKGYWYREWAPQAQALFLTGDFTQWAPEAYPLTRLDSGVWEVFLPDGPDGTPLLRHGEAYKVRVRDAQGKTLDRIPAFARYVLQDTSTKNFNPVHDAPAEPYVMVHPAPPAPVAPVIYEAHVGMASEQEKVATYLEFIDTVLPRLGRLGYNTIQLMAIQEHPYYGSYGYHVSSLFAPSSRFGTPDDLRRLIDAAHAQGIRVIIDIVHSHAVRNLLEGLDRFDGTEGMYFRPGAAGEHPAWDSKLYHYGRWPVLQFLLSNLRYWLEEFGVDGFRFDGVTSMLYHHHGLGKEFAGYADYFSADTDEEAVAYLQLATDLCRAIRPDVLLLAEDVSGMPGLCRPTAEGGIGFTHRLAMGLPDMWIKQIKEIPDEGWDLEALYWVMLNRRKGEPVVAYLESHDQALVGDQTIAFRLMGADMYRHMNRGSQSLVVDRGMALHKMLRLFTIALGGEGWLTFMGNEFGHPEWIDFPRAGNEWSYRYARRQWSLSTSPFLRYGQLEAFDQAMIGLIETHKVLTAPPPELLSYDREHQTIVFERAGLVWAFNFDAVAAEPGYLQRVPAHGKYRLILSSDDERYGGFGRAIEGTEHFTDRHQMISFYNTNRTAQVFVNAH